MANRDTIYKELIQLDWEVKDQDEFFDKMTDKLLELGYVKDTFRDAIKTREANYPTALPVEPYTGSYPSFRPREYHQTIYRMYKIKRYD